MFNVTYVKIASGNLLWMLFISLIISTSCQTNSGLKEPPEIYYGEDVCDRCGMIITEAKHAAAYVTTNGEIRLFDDIGGMIFFNKEHSEEVQKYWAHDFHTEEWINAEHAFYVVHKEITTPMSYGIIAFLNIQAALIKAAEFDTIAIDFITLSSSYLKSGFNKNESMEMSESN
jgi:copper chaperone NosL